MVVDPRPAGLGERLEAICEALTVPVAVSAHAPRLARVLNAARAGGAELAVIDTAPHASDAALSAARASDLTLVPCRASGGRPACDPVRACVVLNAVPVQGPLAALYNWTITGGRTYEERR